MDTLCDKLIDHRLKNAGKDESFMHIASFLIGGGLKQQYYSKVGRRH